MTLARGDEPSQRARGPFDDEALEGVLAELDTPQFGGTTAEARSQRATALLNDPVALGVIGALLLGAVSAAGFALIGFMVSAGVTARERTTEFALLRAMGVSPRQLFGWLSLENAFLLAIGLVAGSLLGVGLAWLVLPFITLTQQATAVVPEVQVQIPWGLLGLLYVLALAALVLTIALLSGLLRRMGLAGALRLGEE
jgi:ABC-type antimicrobial peptide transport system permease subunit